MNKPQLLAGALSAALLVSALPGLALGQDEETSYAAEDVQWVLNTLAGADVAEGVEVTLTLSGGDATGNAGCNSYFGTYEIDETSLTFPSPFGSTMMLCQSPAQETEDAYLPLLGGTAGWSVDEAGMLRLTDAEGTETLVYSEQPIDITATDVDALNAELESLQTQIDEATVAVEELTAAAESVNVKKITNRIGANEEAIAALQDQTKGLNVDNIKKRLKALETAVADLDKQLQNTKKRVKTLEDIAADHEARIAAIEAQVPIPEPA